MNSPIPPNNPEALQQAIKNSRQKLQETVANAIAEVTHLQTYATTDTEKAKYEAALLEMRTAQEIILVSGQLLSSDPSESPLVLEEKPIFETGSIPEPIQ